MEFILICSLRSQLSAAAHSAIQFQFHSSLPNGKNGLKWMLTGLGREEGRLVCLFFSCFWWVMAAASGRGSAKRKKTKEKTNQADPPLLFSINQHKPISLFGLWVDEREKSCAIWLMEFVFLFLIWGGYGRQQAAKGSAKERKQKKNKWNESIGAERQPKVAQL